MDKMCIFCGKKPQDKNKEHVIPRWLIELTGDPKREAVFGFRTQKSGKVVNRSFAFDQFQFPACSSCNSDFSSLERKSKDVILTVINGGDITVEDAHCLLDWFDKVRVGLWLGMMMMLDRNSLSVEPIFHINTRVATQDRLLRIERSSFMKPGLIIQGIVSMGFMFNPCAFSLMINNYHFTNVSCSDFFQRRLGFPYFKEKYVFQDGVYKTLGVLEFGKERINLPLIRRPPRKNSVVIYQPIFGGFLEDDECYRIYDCKYVRDRSLDFDRGYGNIFFEKNNSLIMLNRGVNRH